MATIQELENLLKIQNDQPSGVKGHAEFVLKNLNLGLARMAGVASSFVDLIDAPFNFAARKLGMKEQTKNTNPFPTGEKLQEIMSEYGMTYDPGTEPESIAARTFQNIGASLPFLPFTATTAVGAMAEATSSIGAAAGGVGLQATPWGKRHPELARALGELGGGFGGGAGGVYVAKGGIHGIGAGESGRLVKKAFNPKRRASKRLSDISTNPERARKEISKALEFPEGKYLTPGQASGDVGISRLAKTVEIEKPIIAEKLARKREVATRMLEKKFLTTGGSIDDARNLLDAKLTKHVDDATVALSKIGDVDDPALISTYVEKKLSKALHEARIIEDHVWNKPKSSEMVEGKNLATTMKKHLDDITEGGDIKEVSRFAIKKLGKLVTPKRKPLVVANVGESGRLYIGEPGEIHAHLLERMGEKVRHEGFVVKGTTKFLNREQALSYVNKKGKAIIPSHKEGLDAMDLKSQASKLEQTKPEAILSGGILFNEKKKFASAKAVHQFYSRIGREVQELSTQRGQANRIRLLKELREAAMKDLEAAGLSDEYLDAIQFSRELNEKFTRGAVGRVLGFERGDTPSPAMAIDEIVKRGGIEGKESIIQALNASPQVKVDIENFIRSRFIAYAKNEATGRINARAGEEFLKRFGGTTNDHAGILNTLFPKLRDELQDAIIKQKRVDEMVGVKQASVYSPLFGEKTAAAMFLQSDPGEEMARLIRNTNIQRTKFLSDLVEMTKLDPTGKAFRGLQNGFANEIIKYGKSLDEISISGIKMLKRLRTLEKTAISSKLFTHDEYKRLKRIADVFRRIEIEVGAKPLEGGIIHDLPHKLLSNPLRIFAARIGGKIGSESMGGSLAMAHMFSRETKEGLVWLTNDKAKRLLIESIFDPELMDDLLRNIENINPTDKAALFNRLSKRASELVVDITKLRATTVVPALASSAAYAQQEKDKEEILNILNKWRSGK